MSEITQDRPLKGLIFQSGFEKGSYTVLKKGRAKDIRGIDHSVSHPNNWDKNWFNSGKNFWINYVDYDRGGSNPRLLGSDIVNDPSGEPNRVFYTWQKDAERQNNGAFSRVQGELEQLNWPEVYYKVRFRLSNDIAKVNQSNQKYGLSLVEFFTGNRRHRKLARVILHKKAGKNKLVWFAEIQNFDSKGHTLYKSSQVQPKYDTWQTLEFYLKAGDESQGRYWVRLNGSQVLFNERVETQERLAQHPIHKATILKSYGGSLVKDVKRRGGQVDIWFDDLEIWNKLPRSVRKDLS